MKLVERLKAKREELIAAKEQQQKLYQNNSMYRFYEQSLQLSNATTGHVYLITPDEVLEESAPGKSSHKKVCEEILSEKFHQDIHFDSYDDFGEAIAEEYHTIFVRMVSILNNVSVLYYPKNINEFQLRELKKIKEQLDDYNALHKREEKAEIIYTDENGNESNNLNALIRTLEARLQKRNSNVM